MVMEGLTIVSSKGTVILSLSHSHINVGIGLGIYVMLTCPYRCWRNGGVGEKADYWQDMGEGDPIFKAKGMGDIRGVRFGESDLLLHNTKEFFADHWNLVDINGE